METTAFRSLETNAFRSVLIDSFRPKQSRSPMPKISRRYDGRLTQCPSKADHNYLILLGKCGRNEYFPPHQRSLSVVAGNFGGF